MLGIVRSRRRRSMSYGLGAGKLSVPRGLAREVIDDSSDEVGQHDDQNPDYAGVAVISLFGEGIYEHPHPESESRQTENARYGGKNGEKSTSVEDLIRNPVCAHSYQLPLFPCPAARSRFLKNLAGKDTFGGTANFSVIFSLLHLGGTMSTRTLLQAAALFLFLRPVMAAAPDEPGWKLVWEDSFDRADVGPDWFLFHGKASIEDGRLLLQGGAASIVSERTFGPEVRLEFEAQSHPDMAPCDLSANLAAGKTSHYTYLLAFGGTSNQRNHILGPGVRQVDENPPFLIEPGKKYHMVAQRKGDWLSYTVNGTTILEAQVEDPVSGPGFDRIGFVTWTGMYVDNLKVYERENPSVAPPIDASVFATSPFIRDGRKLQVKLGLSLTPEAMLPVEAFNRGDLEEALRLFGELEDPRLSLWGRAWVLGDLAYQESDSEGELKALGRDFGEWAATQPGDNSIQGAARAFGWFGGLWMNRAGTVSAERLLGLDSPDLNPFYHKARMYRARFAYWDGLEGGFRQQTGQGVEMMRELKHLWPDHPVLKQYTGEPVPWGEELRADEERHPAWAAWLHEAYARQIRIMEEWFSKRQQADGQLGGGWGDDVELMRTWVQIAAISSGAPEVREGIRKLADGVWLTLDKGYSPETGDIEHAAEPGADTVPVMLLLFHGEPEYLERNALSCQTIREQFMGMDHQGYPRFMSAEFGTEGVNTNPRGGGDTGYHARAMRHFIWQAWAGDTSARDWFAAWTDGWRAATMARNGSKLPGVPPPTLWYPSGSFYPPGDTRWWDNTLNYYGTPGLPGMVYDCFLAAYALTGEERFLHAFRYAADRGAATMPEGSSEPPSKRWQYQVMQTAMDAQKLALYRQMTGDKRYDDWLRRLGDPWHRYLLDRDLEKLTGSLRGLASGLRNNLELRTTEVLATDRAALDGALTVFGAYTGAVQGLRDASMPSFGVTWESDGTDFAALVERNEEDALQVRLYSFRDSPQTLGLRLWRLKPGSYELTLRPPHGGGAGESRQVTVRARADVVDVVVPGRQEHVVEMRLVKAAN